MRKNNKRLIIKGVAAKDKKTKQLVKRLNKDHIAVIDHEDLDKVSAYSLVKTGVKAVVNASLFSTGTYPNQGPKILLDAGIYLIEDIGKDAFEKIEEGKEIIIEEDKIYQDEKLIAIGSVLDSDELEKRMEGARRNLEDELVKFTENTMEYIKRERKYLFEDLEIPNLTTEINGRNCLVVVRGHDFEHDIEALLSFIRNEKPVIIAVDGAADVLLEKGIKPDIIVGDMDSVSPESLKAARDVVVHAYLDGRAPGLAKALEAVGNKNVTVFKFQGTSEDAALILAYELGASLIVLVGSHINLIDFLDKGRKGMASTFLTRLRVGDRLIDAKGVNRIYRTHASPVFILTFFIVLILFFSFSITFSPPFKNFLSFILLKIQSWLTSL